MGFDPVSYVMGKAAGGGSAPVVAAESFSIQPQGSATIPAETGDLIVVGRESISIKAIYWVDITGTPIMMAGSGSYISISSSEGNITIKNTHSGAAFGVSVYRAPWHA